MILTDKIDTSDLVTNSLKAITKKGYLDTLPELIFLTRLDKFNPRLAEYIANIITNNRIAKEFYELTSPYISSFEELFELVNIINNYSNWLKGLDEGFKGFIFNYLTNIIIIFHSNEIVREYINFIKNFYTCKFKNEVDNNPDIKAIKVQILIVILNISIKHLIKQFPKELLSDLTTSFNYIIRIAPVLFKLEEKDDESYELFESGYSWDIIYIYDFLLKCSSRLSPDLKEKIFDVSYKTGFHSPSSIFPVWIELFKLGHSSVRKLISILNKLEKTRIHYGILFEIILNTPEVINLKLFDYIISKRNDINIDEYNYLMLNLCSADFFEIQLKQQALNNCDFIDWLFYYVSEFKKRFNDEELITISYLYCYLK